MKRLHLVVALGIGLALAAALPALAALRPLSEGQRLADRALAKVYGAPGDSTTHSCGVASSAVTLTGGAGKAYRVLCPLAAWVRMGTGNTATTAAPSTPLIANLPETWVLTADPTSGGVDPVINCIAASATVCTYTPMTDVP